VFFTQSVEALMASKINWASSVNKLRYNRSQSLYIVKVL